MGAAEELRSDRDVIWTAMSWEPEDSFWLASSSLREDSEFRKEVFIYMDGGWDHRYEYEDYVEECCLQAEVALSRNGAKKYPRKLYGRAVQRSKRTSARPCGGRRRMARCRQRSCLRDSYDTSVCA